MEDHEELRQRISLQKRKELISIKSKNHGALRKRKWQKHKLKVYTSGILGFATLWFVASGSSAKEVIVETQEESAIVDVDRPTQVEVVEKDQVPNAPEKNEITYTIADGDIPADIFGAQANYSANDIAALLSQSKEIYDFTKLRIGKEILFRFADGDMDKKSPATEVRYEPTGAKAIIAKYEDGTFDVEEEEILYEIENVQEEVTINNSLFVDALTEGISEATVIGVGEMFSYTIDFASEVREGDTMNMVYEKRTRDGSPAKDGKVLAAVFTNAGKDFYAYYFKNDEGEEGYYDEEARVLERQFLKAPMDFFRITSGYTGKRFHPVLKKYTAHYQIDYAAPTGTPVFSTANGTVTSVGFETGWGKMIRVRHAGGYTTHYAHLSGYAVKKGEKVSQEQTIGYVGSTGWSTGPHLDYGMRLNGKPVNPLKLDLPKGPPIAEKDREKFEKKKEEYDKFLNQ